MPSKLERLLNLTAALLDTPVPLPAETLRRRLGSYPESDASFRRAFERDKDDLREMGVPISVEEVPGTDPPVLGYRIHRDQYAGQLPDLDPDELAALHVAARQVHLEGIDEQEALWKLGGTVEAPRRPQDPVARIPAAPQLGPLFEATTDRAVVELSYRSVRREIEPHRLIFYRGHWYLAGFDRTRGAERLFRVDRIEGEVQVGPAGGFRRRDVTSADPRVRAWEIGEADPVEALVRVDADQAPWALHELGDDAIVIRHEDESVTVRLTVRDPDAFASFVLTFLEHAEVVEPPSLRAQIVEWLRSCAS